MSTQATFGSSSSTQVMTNSTEQTLPTSNTYSPSPSHVDSSGEVATTSAAILKTRSLSSPQIFKDMVSTTVVVSVGLSSVSVKSPVKSFDTSFSVLVREIIDSVVGPLFSTVNVYNTSTSQSASSSAASINLQSVPPTRVSHLISTSTSQIVGGLNEYVAASVQSGTLSPSGFSITTVTLVSRDISSQMFTSRVSENVAD
mmetsp:Transcript_23089/g.68110  ORF Transcript_23089/g.68110 Transcript_23089/m.68110 type:complete len:200 (+) Transcript_23089:2194-2793(+)